MDIGYPQSLHDQLITEGKTGKHHILPDSNATTFHIESAADTDRAVVLFRLSYLYQLLVLQKRGNIDPELAAIDVSDELARMDTSEDLRAIFENVRVSGNER